MLDIECTNCKLECEFADTECYQLRRKNVNVFARTQKRTKTYTVYFHLYKADFGQLSRLFFLTFTYVTIALANHNRDKNLAFFAKFSGTVEFSKVVLFVTHLENFLKTFKILTL